MLKLTLALIVGWIAAPCLAQAASTVSLDSSVFVERTRIDPEGRIAVTLEEPRSVVPGDKLVFVLHYRNDGGRPANDFVVTNPLPGAVLFERAEVSGAQVSVDGGTNWGELPTLTVRETDGQIRAALPSDVTHVRWAFARPIPAGDSGRLIFRGIVR